MSNRESNKGTDNDTANIKWSDFSLIFKQVIEHSLIGIAILNYKGYFLKVNKKACEIWEYKECELIGKTWRDITFNEDFSISEDYINSYENKHIDYNASIEKRYVTGLGKIKTCKITTTALRGSKNEILYFITQIQDITQQKEAIISLKKGLDIIKKLKIN